MLEIVRRSFRNWELQGSYTWSEAIGDAEDFDQVLGNDRSLLREEYGYLAYDQRHVVKLNATTVTPWGVRLGGSVSWESGLPYSKLSFLESRDILPPGMEVFGTVGSRLRQTYTTGKRNDQRNPSYWNVDLRVAKEMRVGRSGVLQLTAEVFNALNDDTIRIDEVVEGQIAATRRFGRQYQLGFRLTF